MWSFGFRHLAGANRRLGFCGLREIRPWQTFWFIFFGTAAQPHALLSSKITQEPPSPRRLSCRKGIYNVGNYWHMNITISCGLFEPSLFPTANLLHFSLWAGRPEKSEQSWNLAGTFHCWVAMMPFIKAFNIPRPTTSDWGKCMWQT